MQKAGSIGLTLGRLQYISCGNTAREQEDNIRRVLDNGGDWVQVRWKNATQKERLALCETIVKHCHAYQAVCIINDSVAIAKIVDADGVHLGLSDESVISARRALGLKKIIGGTANTLDDVNRRAKEGCDYIGLGPYRFTTGKENLSPLLGITGYEYILQALTEQGITVPPLFAIGGITLADVEPIRNTGIYGVAVSGAITQQPHLIPSFKDKLQ